MPSPKRRRLKKAAALKTEAEAPPAEEETIVEKVAEKAKEASKSLGSKLKKLIRKKKD